MEKPGLSAAVAEREGLAMPEGGKGPGRIPRRAKAAPRSVPVAPAGAALRCAVRAAAGRAGALPERGGAPIRPLGGALSRPLSALGLKERGAGPARSAPASLRES